MSTTKPPLLGIAGYARAGKDTVGSYLAKRHGYERCAFADKLRELALACNPILEERLEQYYGGDTSITIRYSDALDDLGYEKAKNTHPEVRDFLVRLGAGARKVLGGDVWLDACLPGGNGDWNQRRWNGVDWIEPGPLTVVTDVRYRNEAQRIHDLGGEVWYISRPGLKAANEEEQRSIAELLNSVPVKVVVNSGAFYELHFQIEHLLR